MRRSVKKSKKKRDVINLDNIVASSVAVKDPLETISTDLIAALKSAGCDALVSLARYANGDVVGLGLMTQEEFDAEEEYNENGICIKPSGRTRALQIIPSKIRASCLQDLTGYLVAKKGKDLDPEGPQAAVHFYLPENGRDKKS